MDQKTNRDRNPGNDAVVPSEDTGREAQDRPKNAGGTGGARSPVDAMHVDAPTRQENERGHRMRKNRRDK